MSTLQGSSWRPLQSEAHAEAQESVVGMTQQHKVNTYYKLMLNKGI